MERDFTSTAIEELKNFATEEAESKDGFFSCVGDFFEDIGSYIAEGFNNAIKAVKSFIFSDSEIEMSLEEIKKYQQNYVDRKDLDTDDIEELYSFDGTKYDIVEYGKNNKRKKRREIREKIFWCLDKALFVLTCIILISVIYRLHFDRRAVGGDYEYEINKKEKTVTITDYLQSGSEDMVAVIPKHIHGYKVTEIGECAFSGASVVRVKLPSTIEIIGKHAFDNCRELQIVEGMENVSEIGEYAFAECKSLREVDFSGVTVIPLGVLKQCSSLDEIIVPDGVETIEEGAFGYCVQPRKIYISETVRKMDDLFTDGFKTKEQRIEYMKSWNNIYIDEVTIITTQGSVADTYAQDYGIKVEYN